MDKTFTASVVAAEFVPDGDPHRDDEDDAPRPAGTYLTVRLDDDTMAIVSGKVEMRYLPRTDPAAG